MYTQVYGRKTMVNFETWWKYRDGKELMMGAGLLVLILGGMALSWPDPVEDPDICRNLCIEDKNGIPRYPEWFKEHPEDRVNEKRG